VTDFPPLIVLAELLSSNFLAAFERRCLEAEEFNARLPTATPGRRLRLRWLYLSIMHRTGQQGRLTLEKEWRSGGGRRQASMVWSLNEVMAGFWAGGVYKVG
jgi:ATP-binding cassette subfamily C (CFTR/MRP) protein 1